MKKRKGHWVLVKNIFSSSQRAGDWLSPFCAFRLSVNGRYRLKIRVVGGGGVL